MDHQANYAIQPITFTEMLDQIYMIFWFVKFVQRKYFEQTLVFQTLNTKTETTCQQVTEISGQEILYFGTSDVPCQVCNFLIDWLTYGLHIVITAGLDGSSPIFIQMTTCWKAKRSR